MSFLASAGGGLIGAAQSAEAANNAGIAAKNAYQQWLSLNVPDPSQQALYLQQYKQTGQLNPQFEQAMKMGPSALNNVQTNPQLQSAQMQALQQLQQEGNQGGLGLQDQATQMQQQLQANSASKGRNDAIMQQFAQQGQGGSGMQLIAQLQNAQNANQNQAMTSLQSAANARQRALQSVAGAGQLGGQMEAQQYSQQANAARAQDAINQFNTQNAQNVQNSNVNSANQAQQYNLGLQQQIANANTGLSNQQQAYNKGLLQSNYEDQLQKTQGAGNAAMGYANQQQGQAANTANMWSGIGSSTGKGIAGYNQDQNNSYQSGSGGSLAGTGYGSAPSAGSQGVTDDEEE